MRSDDGRQPFEATPQGAIRVLGLVLLPLHLALVTWFALNPAPASWVYDANLTPFASVHSAFVAGGLTGLLRVAGTALTMAPLGALLPLAGGRRQAAWLPSFLHSCGATAVIATALEFVRTTLGGQVLNVDDVLLGVLGAGLVHLALAPAARALLRGRTPKATPAPSATPVPSAAPAAPSRAASVTLAAPRPLNLAKPRH